MIDDKTVKMAVNTIAAYCAHHGGCNKCAIRNNCLEVSGVSHSFGNLISYPGINKAQKPPKFDIRQKDSADFWKYINEIFMHEAEKYGLPMNTANSIKWTARGTIVVTFVDDDNKTNYVGIAKCHPDDAFNPEIGIKLAIERAAQAMKAPFIPGCDENYYLVGNKDTIYSTVNRNEAADALCIALGNSFRTYNQAKANAGVIIKRMEKAVELLNKLREDDK